MKTIWPRWALCRFACVAVLSAAVLGCGSSVNRNFASSGEPTGWVALTYTEIGYANSFVSPTIQFRRVGETGEFGHVGRNLIDAAIGPSKYLLSDERPRLDVTVTAANPSGFPVVLELPVGEYEFYRYYGSKTVPQGLGNRTTTLQSKNPFSIRFSVKAQAVTYIGNLNLDYAATGVRLSISDQSTRDLAVIQGRTEEIKGKPVAVEIARVVR